MASLARGYVNQRVLAVGVLLDIVATHVYEALTGGGPDIDEALKNAHDQGFREGASTAAQLVTAKAGDLMDYQETAFQGGLSHLADYRVALMRARDLKTIHELTVIIQAEIATLKNAMAPDANLVARRLIKEWVDAHAGAGPGLAAKDVNQADYTNAQAMLPPDLPLDMSNSEMMQRYAQDHTMAVPFAAQLRHEWGLRGLPPPADFEASLVAVMATAKTLVKPDTAKTSTEMEKAPANRNAA